MNSSWTTHTLKRLIQSTMSQIGDIIFSSTYRGRSAVTCFFTANTMMQSVRERIPEIGV